MNGELRMMVETSTGFFQQREVEPRVQLDQQMIASSLEQVGVNRSAKPKQQGFKAGADQGEYKCGYAGHR